MNTTGTPSPSDPDVPVLVVGAGLGGTAAAAFLAHLDVPTVVLDQRDGPSRRPRARMVSAGSQEMLRGLGLAEDVVSLGERGSYEIHVVETLSAAPEQEREADPTATVSPTGAALLDQDLLEGLLREHAATRGVEVRWGQEVTALDDDGDGVTVHVRGAQPLRARYVVLAQGARAGLRGSLGINALSTSEPGEFEECLFRSTALDDLMASRPGAGFVCTANGASVLRRDAGRWTITRYGQPLEDPQRDVATAVGIAVDVEEISRGTWRPSAQLATSFRAGDVFLIGDAAHSMPPSVGMAGNLAIADAHNLAWRLALVLGGEAGPALLDGYAAERRAVAKVVLDEALLNLRGEHAGTLPDAVLQLGIGYPPAASPTLLSDDLEQPLVDPASLRPRVGARLPHQWLPDGRSTVDLADGRRFFTVGSCAVGTAPLQHHRIDVGDADLEDGEGQVWIVRPDGYVAAQVSSGGVPAAMARLLDQDVRHVAA